MQRLPGTWTDISHDCVGRNSNGLLMDSCIYVIGGQLGNLESLRDIFFQTGGQLASLRIPTVFFIAGECYSWMLMLQKERVTK
jgi:hypothetical protein